MDQATVLNIVARFREALGKQSIHNARLILFGSHARGDAHEGSDIDLVVVSNDFVGKDYWRRINILTEAIYEVFEPIQAVALTPEEWAAGELTICEYAKDGVDVAA